MLSRRLKYKVLFIGFLLLFFFSGRMVVMASSSVSRVVRVGLEPLPPLIIDENTGYTVDLLKKIEKISDLKFHISIMPYNRAKRMLRQGRVDLIGHIPCRSETSEFYSYARELDFKIDVKTDIYVTDRKRFENIDNLKIGIPWGNEEFAAKLLRLPRQHFYSGSLESLLLMLVRGRIDAFWFERSATISTLRKLGISNIYYMKLPEHPAPAGLAVRKSRKGILLQEKLDALLGKMNGDHLLNGYTRFLAMPDTGMVH
jgi:polar amino acid transport system substrate-binding protein